MISLAQDDDCFGSVLFAVVPAVCVHLNPPGHPKTKQGYISGFKINASAVL